MPLTSDRLALHRRLLLVAERTSWALGLVGLVCWAVYHIGVGSSTRHDLERFAARQVAATQADTPDLSLWSPNRVSAWHRAVSEPSEPLAVLRISKIRLEVSVLPGTKDLDRGVGHIEDTAQPGTDGNAGIAGHRDGFFRGLKDIAPGDAIELDTLHGKEVYRVERTWVVDPEDVSVLDPTPTRALTLVTCYPFYFVGAAPQRFIVRAVRVGHEPVPPPSSTQRVPCPLCGSWRLVSVLRPSQVASMVRFNQQSRMERVL
jgi:sortase A